VIFDEQVPSVLIDCAAVEVEVDFEDVVDVFTVVEEVVALDEVDTLTELELEEPVQVPPTGLHPAPQYAEVEPHHPLTLQQLPKVDPMQVVAVPHVPSVEIA